MVAADAAGRSNPFEARSNKKTRFEVLGRRVKGAERNVALSRSKGSARRAISLGSELRALGKVNSFVDRRFGEADDSLDIDTKNLVRLQKERLRQLNVSKKKSRFQLESGGARGSSSDVLTHFGRAVSELADDRDGRQSSHDDDDEFDDDDFQRDFTAAHFGGGGGGRGSEDPTSSIPSWRGKAPQPAWKSGDGSPDAGAAPHRSYKEIMEEVIAKSKLGRAERAREKVEQETELALLDQQMSVVSNLLRTHRGAPERDGPRKRRRGGDEDGVDDAIAEAERMLAEIEAQKSERATSTGSAAAADGAAVPSPAASSPAVIAAAAAPRLSASSKVDVAAAAAPNRRGGGDAAGHDDYDALVFKLAGESRSAIARDRSKSTQELAEAEAERLAELEGLRQARRMGGSSATGEHDGSSSSKAQHTKIGPVDSTPSESTAASAASEYAVGGGGDDLGPVITSTLTLRQKRRAKSGVSLLDYAAAAAAAAASGDDGDAASTSSDDDGSSDADGGSSDNEEEEDGSDVEDAADGDGGDDDDDDDSDFDNDLSLEEHPSTLPSMQHASASAAPRSGVAAAAAAASFSGGQTSTSGRVRGSTSTSVVSTSARPTPSTGTSVHTNAPRFKPSSAPAASTDAAAVPEMPFVLPCPTTHAEFDAMVQRYCAPLLTSDVRSSGHASSTSPAAEAASGAASAAAADASSGASAALAELIRRIRARHSILVGASNKGKLLTLYSVLLEDLVACGDAAGRSSGSSPTSTSNTTVGAMPQWRVEPVFAVLFEMSQEGPLQVELGGLWRAAIDRIRVRIAGALSAPTLGDPAGPTSTLDARAAPALSGCDCWPTGGEALLMRVAAKLFPCSDFRHVVINSLLLLSGQLLTQVPISNETDVCRGLFVADFVMGVARESRKLMPEVVAFTQSVLAAFATTTTSSSSSGGSGSSSMALPPQAPNFAPLISAVRAPHPRTRPAAVAAPVSTPANHLLALALSEGSHAGDGGVPFSVMGTAYTESAPRAASAAKEAGGRSTRGQLCRSALLSACALTRALASVCVPHEFFAAATAAALEKSTVSTSGTSARSSSSSSLHSRSTMHTPGALAERLMEASTAPSGDAARALASSSGSTSTDTLRSVHVLQPVPLACTPQVLDPLLAALATISAVAQVHWAATAGAEAKRLVVKPTAAHGSSSGSGVGSGGGTTVAAAVVAAAVALEDGVRSCLRAVVPLRDAVAALRAPLRLRERAGPAPSIRTFAPLLEDVNAPRAASAIAAAKHSKLDASAIADAEAKEEMRALNRAKKREARGAVRELRLDRSFIVREKETVAAARDAERNTNYKELMGFLEKQAATHNQMVKKGGGIAKQMDASGSGGGTLLNVGKTKADRMAKKRGLGDRPQTKA